MLPKTRPSVLFRTRSLASSEKRTQSSLNNKRCVFVDRFKCIEMMRNTCRGGRNLWIEQAVLRIYIRVQFNISQEISVRYIPYWKYWTSLVFKKRYFDLFVFISCIYKIKPHLLLFWHRMIPLLLLKISVFKFKISFHFVLKSLKVVWDTSVLWCTSQQNKQ